MARVWKKTGPRIKENLPTPFGRVLYRHRMKKNLTYASLSEMCNPPIKIAAISRWELGHVDMPIFSTLTRLATALGVPIQEFVEEIANEKEQQRG